MTDADARDGPAVDDPIVRTARREALLVAAVFTVALVWTETVCWSMGYARSGEERQLQFVLGFPDWVFWGIVVPWTTCLAFSLYFGSRFMQDIDLGPDDAPEGG